jgi:hypothetical protein
MTLRETSGREAVDGFLFESLVVELAVGGTGDRVDGEDALP